MKIILTKTEAEIQLKEYHLNKTHTDINTLEVEVEADKPNMAEYPKFYPALDVLMDTQWRSIIGKCGQAEKIPLIRLIRHISGDSLSECKMFVERYLPKEVYVPTYTEQH